MAETGKRKPAKASYARRTRAVPGAVREPAVPYATEPPTFESVWRLFQEHDKKLAQLEELFVTQWGKLVESLVEGDLVPLLRVRGIDVELTARRVTGCYQGRNFEFDIIAYDGDTIVIVEVKTTLRPQDVQDFLDCLALARTWMPGYAGKRICGAVAYLLETGKAAVMAEKRGLFAIRATGASASIINAPAFKPKAF